MEAKKLLQADLEPFQLSLRIRHPSMDPAELSWAFRIEPEHSFRAGAPRTLRSGGASASVHPESYWLGVLEPAEQRADLSFSGDHRSQIAQKQLAAVSNSLSWALCLRTSRVLKANADLLRRVRSEGGDVTLLVMICSGEVSSFTLAPEASQMFGELGITVEFELTSE